MNKQRFEQVEEVVNRTFPEIEQRAAFITGVAWADNHPWSSPIWHPADEEPDREQPILIVTDGEDWDERFSYLRMWADWGKTVEYHKMKMWAKCYDLVASKGGLL